MNDQRLRLDLAALADEVTSVDLRDRTLRTSRRLGIQRAVATSAAALVLIAAATGTAFAIRPNQTAPPLPADSPTVGPPTGAPTPTPTPSPPTAATGGPAAPATSRSVTAGAAPDVSWYSWGGRDGSSSWPGKVWRKTSGGRWQVVASHDSYDDGITVRVPSPDGRQLAWIDKDSSPHKVYVAGADGSDARVVGTLTRDAGCGDPVWIGPHRLVLTEGEEVGTYVSVNDRGGARRVITTSGPVPGCRTPVPSGTGLLFGEGRKLTRLAEDGSTRETAVRLPAGLVVMQIAGASSDGRKAVLVAHKSSAGETSELWHYLVDLRTGDATELAPQDPRWRKQHNAGWIKNAVFTPSGEIVAQVNTMPDPDDNPRFRLVRYDAEGQLLGSIEVPKAATNYGTLIG